MTANRYEYLSGAISVNADAPDDWEGADELPFWKDPNNSAWGDTLCRILYHETIHFWQFLSSAYVANLVAQEWSRLIRYEQTRELMPPGDPEDSESDGATPFSPSELVECWARYWDVHSRGPDRIIAEESIPVNDTSKLQKQFGGQTAYTGEAFDTVMQVGRDCAVYGRPYRWLLEKLSGHSASAALIFPIAAHGAFSAPNPVEVFCRCVEKALQSAAIREKIDTRTGSINYDWLTSYRTVVADTLVPIFQESNRKLFCSGFDVINNTILQTHPIFSEYPSKFVIDGYLKLHYPIPDPKHPPEFAAKYTEALLGYARTTSIILLGLPGQPFYRLALGYLVPPPRINFRNMTWYASRPIQMIWPAIQAGKEIDRTYKQLSDNLALRIERYRAAKKAVELGLPPNAFES